MTTEKLEQVLKAKSRLDFYNTLEAFIKASGVTGIINFNAREEFKVMLQDANELEWLRNELYPIITKRLTEIREEFDKL